MIDCESTTGGWGRGRGGRSTRKQGQTDKTRLKGPEAQEANASRVQHQSFQSQTPPTPATTTRPTSGSSRTPMHKHLCDAIHLCRVGGDLHLHPLAEPLQLLPDVSGLVQASHLHVVLVAPLRMREEKATIGGTGGGGFVVSVGEKQGCYLLATNHCFACLPQTCLCFVSQMYIMCSRYRLVFACLPQVYI